jgi:aminoglycoside phosphotransferase (APT) family kinase protein
MHRDEIEVDEGLARAVLSTQAPHLAGLSLERIDALGTDHTIFRLGGRLALRMPRIHWAAEQGEKEHRWLPVLAPLLPVEVPVPVLLGEPAHGYPFRWYVAPWLAGENPRPDGSVDLRRLAVDLAAFVRVLHDADTTGAPPPKPGQRGGPLGGADRATRRAAGQLRGDVDVEGLLEAWDAGLRAEPWAGAAVWAHGDLSDGNLLVRDGALSGVIDWGGLVAGDPAVDLMVAWNLLDGAGREAYRDELAFVDDAMWVRGRAWAASAAIQALPYYRHTNPDIVARSRRAAGAIVADLQH